MLACTYWNCRFGYNNFIAVEVIGNRACGRLYKTEVWRTVRFWRGANSEENDQGLFDSFTNVGRKVQTTSLGILGNQLFQAGLINGHDALVQTIYLFSIDVNTRHIDTKLREAGPRHKADIAGTNHCDMHSLPDELRDIDLQS